MTASIKTLWKSMVTRVFISKGVVRSAMVVESFTNRAGELFAVVLLNFCNLILPIYNCMPYALTELLAAFPFALLSYGYCTMFSVLKILAYLARPFEVLAQLWCWRSFLSFMNYEYGVHVDFLLPAA